MVTTRDDWLLTAGIILFAAVVLVATL